MWPIGPLMHEHRLIERMIALMAAEAQRLRGGGELDRGFLGAAVEFIRSYADRCHHGKEEDILFKDLAGRDLAPELGALMQELIEDHKYGRSLVGRLVSAREAGDRGQCIAILEELAEFYPRHIEKEDKHFFFPCMELFGRQEKDAMLAAFYEFDRHLIHEHFRAVVEGLEKQPRR
ncbi:MAG: hemerythrin domain-containing protein [Thermodesulfobacteriota bacterium]